MTITMYAIKNCDTVKKARAWLEQNKVDYEFHDHKTDGVDPARLSRWCDKLGWDVVCNQNGITFKKLPDKEKKALNRDRAMKLMMAQPSMIKRPLLDLGGGKYLLGFKPEAYAAALAKVKAR